MLYDTFSYHSPELHKRIHLELYHFLLQYWSVLVSTGNNPGIKVK